MPLKWSSEMDGVLRDCLASGHSFSDVAQKVGLTRSAVAGRAHRLNVKVNLATRPTIGIKIARMAKAKLKVKPVEYVPPAPKPKRRRLRPVSFERLQSHHCRYPVDRGNGKAMQYCGEPKVDGLPYCAPHCQVCFHQGPLRGPGRPLKSPK